MFRAHYKNRFKVSSLNVGHAIPLMAVLAFVFGLLGCESAIAPPEELQAATIHGTVNYHGDWPSPDSVIDLRFVALRFVPVDTSDFLQLNRMEISSSLSYGVERDSFTMTGIKPGVFPFSGVARQVTTNIFSWAPIGLYEAASGVLELNEADVVNIVIDVDFNAIPPFPRVDTEGH